MLKLITELTTLCVGVFIYEYMTEQQWLDALTYSYWLVLGGVIVYLRFVNNKDLT